MRKEDLVTTVALLLIIASVLVVGHIVPPRSQAYPYYLITYYFMIWVLFLKLYFIDKMGSRVSVFVLVFMQFLGMVLIGRVLPKPLETAPVFIQSLAIVFIYLLGIWAGRRWSLLIVWGNIAWIILRGAYVWWDRTSVEGIVFYLVVAVVYTCFIYKRVETIYPSLFVLGIACDWRELHNILFGWKLLGKLYISKPYLPIYSYLASPGEYSWNKKSLTIFILTILISNIIDMTPIPIPHNAFLKRITVIPAIIIPFYEHHSCDKQYIV